MCHADAKGFDGVLTAACDALPMPDLTRLVGDEPAVIAGHWLFGFWPTALAGDLHAWLSGQPDRSVRGWLARCGATEIEADGPIFNLNTKADLAAYEAGLSSGHQLR
jgi:molybdopterin-guanine dinucleotide biosynthesis protein A